MKFKVSRTTREILGVKFEYNGFSFSGSKVSREFSYLNIDNRLEQNAWLLHLNTPSKGSRIKMKRCSKGFPFRQWFKHRPWSVERQFILRSTAAEEAEFNRLMKKKKDKRKRGFHL